MTTQFYSNTDVHERNQVINHVADCDVSLKVMTPQLCKIPCLLNFKFCLTLSIILQNSHKLSPSR